MFDDVVAKNNHVITEAPTYVNRLFSDAPVLYM